LEKKTKDKDYLSKYCIFLWMCLDKCLHSKNWNWLFIYEVNLYNFYKRHTNGALFCIMNVPSHIVISFFWVLCCCWPDRAIFVPPYFTPYAGTPFGLILYPVASLFIKIFKPQSLCYSKQVLNH